MKSIMTRIISGLSLVAKRTALEKPLDLRQPVEPAQPAPKMVRGNSYSKRYHRRGCEYGDKMSHPQIFTSFAEARSHGYRACSVCLPDGDTHMIR